MTNGEMMQLVFPDMEIERGELKIYAWIENEPTHFELDWWNAEYTGDNRWIPVNERLPEEPGEYLIAWVPLDVDMKRYFKGHSYMEFAEFENGEWVTLLPQAKNGYEVLAWRPLPETYKEDEQ